MVAWADVGPNSALKLLAVPNNVCFIVNKLDQFLVKHVLEANTAGREGVCRQRILHLPQLVFSLGTASSRAGNYAWNSYGSVWKLWSSVESKHHYCDDDVFVLDLVL
ncbi:hypothetical protein Ancab_022590 [Ancistrocladus abbreviatus]